MRSPRTLRGRIAFYFCGYLSVLLTAYSGALIFVLNASEDRAFNRQLAEVAEGLRQHFQDHGVLPDSLPLHVTAHIGFGGIPARLKSHIVGRPPGVFEIDSDGLDYHVAIFLLPSSLEPLYVLYDVGSIETTDRFESYLILALTGVALGILLLGWALAHALSNRILDPISALAGEVQALTPDADNTALRDFDTPDEVGMLARKINQLLGRIADFTRREREFTAHASHELRTPVTVIRGAMEILCGRSETAGPACRRPMVRIERAVKDIEMLIDTFLLLARRGQIPDPAATCDLKAVVDEVVAAHRYLLTGKPVDIDVCMTDAGPVPAPASLVTIALGNLVRNAFKYTASGRILILAAEGRVCVRDSGPGFESSHRGAGLGLTIVERLCERMHWGFTIGGKPGAGTSAELVFTPRESTPGESFTGDSLQT
jgi:signal transduction histidine kinase